MSEEALWISKVFCDTDRRYLKSCRKIEDLVRRCKVDQFGVKIYASNEKSVHWHGHAIATDNANHAGNEKKQDEIETDQGEMSTGLEEMKAGEEDMKIGQKVKNKVITVVQEKFENVILTLKTNMVIRTNGSTFSPGSGTS